MVIPCEFACCAMDANMLASDCVKPSVSTLAKPITHTYYWRQILV